MEWKSTYGKVDVRFVYECVANGEVVYVGCTSNPKVRLSTLRSKSAWWTPSTTAHITHAFSDRREAFRFESARIKSLSPRFNVQGVPPDVECNDVPTPQGDYVGVHEAAEILGVSVATVNRMAANGTLPTAAKLHGRTGAHIFNRATVEAKRVAA